MGEVGERGRPAHRSPLLLAVVLLAGCCGTAARYGLVLALPVQPGGWPWPTFLVNITGAFALGLLLEALLRRGADVGRRRLLRLGAGTGFLGAFTTWSAFAVEIDLLAGLGDLLQALGYAAVSLLLGVAAAAAGIAVAARR